MASSESTVLERMPIDRAGKKVKIAFKAGRSVHLWGPPGVGKSALVNDLAVAEEIEFKDVRMSLLNPVDLRGIPVADLVKQIARWLIPEFMPRKGKGILFLDELNVAPPAVQAAAYQLVLDRKVGEYTLPEGWYVIAAGNRASDRALTYEMPSALRNRFVHLEIEPAFGPWRIWAMEHSIDTRVVSFLAWRESSDQDALFQFDPKVHVRAFPTPRSWHIVSDLLRAGADPDTDKDLLAGAVGSGAAMEFYGFCEVMTKLPSADDVVVKGKMDVEFPSQREIGQRYAFCGALVGAALRMSEEDGLEGAKNLTKYCVRSMRDEEYGAMVLKDFAKTPRFKKIFRPLVGSKEWKEAFDKFGALALE